MVADYLIEQTLNDGREIIYTAPIKALSNQKYREYSKRFGSDKVGLVTGDMVINPYAPLRIMTTEILRNILLQESNDIETRDDSEAIDDEIADELDKTTFIPSDTQIRDLDRLEAVIIDEIHFLDDPDRGTVWEELLIYLPSSIRICGLSATLSNMQEFAEWLSEIRETEVKVVIEEQRSVPLQFTFVNKELGRLSPKNYKKQVSKLGKENRDGGGRGRKGGGRGRDNDYKKGKNRKAPRGKRGRGGSSHLDVFDVLEGDHYPALYFIYSRKMTEMLSAQLADSNIGRSIGGRADKRELKKHIADFEAKHPKVLSRKLKTQLTMGIAFHHAGLHVAIKSLVEGLYEARLIQVLYCTSTFALGINMPARTVVFDDITKFNGVEIVPLSVREFMQMAGRAGRRGIDAHGDVVIKLDPKSYKEHEEVIAKLLKKESEPVSSSFNLSFNSVVSLLDRYDEKKIRRILERSFKSHQLALRADTLSDEIEDVADKGDVDSKANRKKVAHLKRLLNDAKRPRLWEQFQKKVVFLQSYDYLTEHMELNAPGRILKNIQFEEIFVTELILAGTLEHLTPEELFGVMTGLSQNLPRTARVSRPADHERWDKIIDDVEYIFDSDIVYGAQQLAGNESTCTGQLMPLGEMWAEGKSLAEIINEIDNPTDLSGDLIGAFRRAKDLVGQVRKINWEDVERRDALRDLMRRVTRDEVEVVS